jgi:hypothetical protein
MGLWLLDLSNGLLWTRRFQNEESDHKIAPSWSWLSQDRVSHDVPCCDETDLYGESMAPTFFFLSTIDKGISSFPLLRVLAPLVRVKCVQDHRNTRKYYLDVCDERLPFADPGNEREEIVQALEVYWDRYANPSYVDATFRCLLLVDRPWDNATWTYGIVLGRVDSKMNLYRRMGIFSIHRKNNNDFWSSEAVWEQFRGLEREEFYIK